MTTPLSSNGPESKIIPPSKWGMRLCRVLPHLWQQPATTEELVRFMNHEPQIKLCLTCRRWVPFHQDSEGSGQVPPHGKVGMLLLKLCDYLDNHL